MPKGPKFNFGALRSVQINHVSYKGVCVCVCVYIVFIYIYIYIYACCVRALEDEKRTSEQQLPRARRYFSRSYFTARCFDRRMAEEEIKAFLTGLGIK